MSDNGLPYALRDQRVLGPEETFRFGCHPGMRCFTRCCGDVNIVLTPVDVLKLSRRLGLRTDEFLDRHTLTPITRELHLPVLLLRMEEGSDKRCPFLGADPQGCTVYDDRPWACRMYPLGMGVPPAKAGVAPTPVTFLFEDDFCDGRGEATDWTVARWLDDQGLSVREELEQGFREIVAHPWFIGGTRTLDPRRIEMFHMAFYNLDKFRDFLFGSSFLKRFALEEAFVDALRRDDLALLRFAPRWLRFAMFGEPTLQLRPAAGVS